MKYFFVLGNAAELAREEVRAVLPHQELFYDPPVLILETEKTIPFERFGGVIKVGEVIDEKIVDYLKSFSRVDFGISTYGEKLPDLREIKRELGELGIRSRFVLPKIGTELSSVIVKKQKLTEVLKYKNLIARTVWVQDFEDWGKRDYGRPEVEAKIGMLPPKVARMMVNIGSSDQVLGSSILDPFCGVGTIISEALGLGIKAIGSDIDPKQIARTRKNLEFFGQKASLFVSDARKISEKIKNIDAIVTESFLGPADPKILEKLYLDCFENWKKVLKPNGKVVIALPFIIDKAKIMGYSLVAGPFIYARPQAKIKRNICVFTFNF
ncbi:methyltransferase domain-containing protein [Candidatus Gottesmanbacteria bacterium]|nr:methyltransferase domain-containing protein [Candidatus Gottesmanbacteria bacterium]